MLKTALVTSRDYAKHFAGRLHPERPERIEALVDMTDSMNRPGLQHHVPREATAEEIALCHEGGYVALMRRTGQIDRFDFDPDTHTSRDSYHTALLAAGGVITATEAVLDGAADNAFAMVRPPGHHALPDRAMGFCFFNNIAIAAAWLIRCRGLKRVMIVDWDVHHGNGTQAMFYDSPEVLYVSTHQYPHYPGTGSLREIGAGRGEGYTINAPLPADFGDDEYLRCFDDFILPIGRQYNPEFILVSSGFDGHWRDPLAQMRLTEAGFTAMARRVKKLAAECCEGKMVVALEGGYDLEGLVNSTGAVLEEMGRFADEPIHSAREGGAVMPIVERAAHNVGRFWNLA
jgi:acetoin utilization deacetylase AcuC-like enzyme